MIIHWDEVRSIGKRLLAWTIFAALVAPFLVLIGAVSFAIAASQVEQFAGTRASELSGIVAASAAVVVTLQALIWWIAR